MTGRELPTVPVAASGAQFLLLVLSANDAALAAGEVLLVTAVLASLLVGAPRRAWPSIAGAALVAGTLLATTGLLVARMTGGRALWLVALALVAVGTLASYGIHRYELVAVGLVDETPSRGAEAGTGGER